MTIIGTELARNLVVNPRGMLAAGSSVPIRRNLADNPSGSDAVGYFAIAGTSGAASVSSTNIGALAYIGNTYIRVAWTTATTAVSGGVEYRNRGGLGIPVTAGLPYSASWWVRPSKAQRMSIRIEWFDAGGVSLGTDASAAAVPIPAGQYARLQVTATAPAGAARAYVRAYAVAGTGGANWAASDHIAADALLFEQTTRVLDYFDSTFALHSTHALDVDGTSIITDDLATVRANLAYNPSAEVDTSYTLLTGVTVASETTRAISGTRSFKVTRSAASGTARCLWRAHLDSAAPGEQFTWSAYVWSAVARQVIPTLQVVDLAGVATTVTGAATDLAADQWTRVSWPASVPAGLPVQSLYMGFDFASTDMTPVWADGVLIERGDVLDVFFDGSTPGDAPEYHAWSTASDTYQPGLAPSRRVATRAGGFWSGEGAEVYQRSGGGVGVMGSITRSSAAESGTFALTPADSEGLQATIVARVQAVDACTLELCDDSSAAATKVLAAGQVAELRSVQTSAAFVVGEQPWWIPYVRQKDAAPKRWVVLGFACVADPTYSGPYFDGSTAAPDVDSRYVWDGAADWDESVWEFLPAPVVTATPDQPLRSVELLAEGIASVELISIRRITPGYEPKLVRSARAAAAVGGTLFAYDHEPPLGLTSQYQAMAHYADGSTSSWSEPIQVAVGCDGNEVWVKDVGQPLRSMRLILRELGGRRRPARTERHDVQGDPYPVVVSDVRSRGEEGVVLGTTTHAEKDKLDALIDTGAVLLLQTPPSWGRRDAFCAFGDSDERRLRQYGPVQHRDWEFRVTEVREPGGDRTGLPDNSYAAVQAEFATYADLLAARPTYLSVLAGTAEIR